MTEPIKPLAVNVRKTIQLTGFCKTTIYALLKSGALERVKVDRHTRITMASIERLMQPEKAA
jgi:hypothetical protein